MSTLKSSAEDLTINADGGSSDIKFQINAVEKASINSSGLLTSTTIDATALTGNLPAIDGSNLTGLSSGLTEADQWRLTTNTSLSTGDTILTANWERVDTGGFDKIGTGMTESSGIFTFPSTGYWLITCSMVFGGVDTGARGIVNYINTTVDDGSNWVEVTEPHGNHFDGMSSYTSIVAEFLFDVTSVSTHKVKFSLYTSEATTLKGVTAKNQTSVTFLRLGDT
jgi:hypothetical protein